MTETFFGRVFLYSSEEDPSSDNGKESLGDNLAVLWAGFGEGFGDNNTDTIIGRASLTSSMEDSSSANGMDSLGQSCSLVDLFRAEDSSSNGIESLGDNLAVLRTCFGEAFGDNVTETFIGRASLSSSSVEDHHQPMAWTAWETILQPCGPVSDSSSNGIESLGDNLAVLWTCFGEDFGDNVTETVIGRASLSSSVEDSSSNGKESLGDNLAVL
ncbi:expressed unknown protein [Seminavis robusta]|uniref:Uncharacterized protein n=1 Tax=Seminavis robusta TaxID=568900 RepID=A0A9N8E3L5_9STRA|nr:expressed unknown protein [Seminavis robusta]|eukprot:Sro467_g148940.1 n/a (214) ;mRNA; r:34689-35579